MCKAEREHEPPVSTASSLGDNSVIGAGDEYPCNAVNIQITADFEEIMEDFQPGSSACNT